MPATGSSRLFSPHRAIGLIADASPATCAVHTLGEETFLTTRVAERSFQVYKLSTLGVALVAPRLRGAPIDALAARAHETYCARADGRIDECGVVGGRAERERGCRVYGE